MRRGKQADEGVQRIAGLLRDLDDKDIERLHAAIRDLAFGVLHLADGRKPGREDIPLVLSDEHGNEYRVYQTPPDVAMIRFLVEQNIGKAGTKLADSFDPEIRVYTTIKGFGEYDPNHPEPPSDQRQTLGERFIYGVDEEAVPNATPDGR